MLRLIFLCLILGAIFAAITRNPRLKRALWAATLLVAAYGLLKASGVVEAIAPARDGVW